MNDVGNDADLDEQVPSSYRRRFAHDLARRLAAFALKLGRRVAPIVIHGVAMNVFILFMALTERTLNFAMAHGPFFFEVPIRLLVQTIDLILLVHFTLLVWREFR